MERVSFTVPAGQITALIGPNGAGKTTLFNLLSGTQVPDVGHIHLREEEITKTSVDERARLGISRTFQLARPFRNLTVFDHLALAQSQGDDSLWSGWVKAPNEQKLWQQSENVLKEVGLDVPLYAFAADLSYGQSKLLAIAMALVHPHELLLLDEPVAGVNPVLRERMAVLLSQLRSQGETILIIEHDMGFVMPLADQVVVLERGKVVAIGTPQEIQKDEEVLRAYLGEQL